MSSTKIDVKNIDFEEFKEMLDSIYKKYNCVDFSHMFSTFHILKISGANFSQILYTTSDFDQTIKELNRIGLFPYSVGIPILKIDTSGRIIPLLPLGDIMKNFCKNKICLPSSIVMKIIYGREVKVNEKYPFKYAILMLNNIFVAYVKVKRIANKTMIIPELDIGWYLRKAG
ncbi:hypothetical protein [Acidianus manzaensis]|uniref:Uncharacterized protein n=1 Tax=Acidianus manzaensis TaxID=282676 RepID=A0A1W6JZV8_9CREN|nr:hypothetical protein [Acidianus manzaensis]ARM75861.1 hypothetical protein B6F84_07315 [Acidianus manzaensis]